MYYTCNTLWGVAVDWSRRADHIGAKRQLAVEHANEALADPNAIIFDPDYNAKPGGRGVRTIGYSPSARDILTVITVEDEGAVYGASAWKSNSRDRRYYNQGGPDE